MGGTVKRTVLVDNDIGVFRLQPENGILVDDYDGDGEDTELSRIASVLEELLFVEDVRDVLGPKFGLFDQCRKCSLMPPCIEHQSISLRRDVELIFTIPQVSCGVVFFVSLLGKSLALAVSRFLLIESLLGYRTIHVVES